MALKLDIRPFETVYINGAEICNGDRKISLLIMNKSRILRESEMIKESDVTSIAAKFVYVLQNFILKEDATGELPELSRLAVELNRAQPEAGAKIAEIMSLLGQSKAHAAFKIGKTLINLETKMPGDTKRSNFAI